MSYIDRNLFLEPTASDSAPFIVPDAHFNPGFLMFPIYGPRCVPLTTSDLKEEFC